jgi:Phage Connector (GP10)
MARQKVPTIPDDKLYYFKEQLYRELASMFEWKGLPTTVPADYLERNLVRYGYCLYYEDEIIGQDVLRCEVMGFNRHDLPTQARTYSPNTAGENAQIFRNIKRLADSQTAIEDFDRTKDGVLIMNMASGNLNTGQHMGLIVEHFAQRLALAQQAFDTNLMWANVPYIFQTSSDDTRLSIEKMFAEIFTGVPFIISDKALYADNKDRAGLPTDIQFIGKELMDVQNEIMMKFKQTVGFDTAGVDKAERTNTLEITSNNQHTKSVLQIMLQQRQIAAEAINAFFGVNVSVDLYAPEEIEGEEIEGEEGEEDGANDNRTGSAAGQD